MSSPIPFQINGRLFHLAEAPTIIEAADQLGIYIPRFCYHKKLSVVANCRMCLVEVAGMPKPVPACSTAIQPNMHVLTRSAKTKAAQQAVMEFLLINDPLDCPVCDQGGQCELQDLAMRYGRDHSLFRETKRAVEDPELGSLVATQMTRCIHCTRCVRFGSEVAGQMELGSIGRGEHTQITTYVKRPLQSELSGNMIDICPVGALTSKPFQFKARAWELRVMPSIAPHDCLGSHLNLHTRDQQVMRVVPRENESINEVWLSDRDRFSYLGINSPERLSQPMIKVGNSWQSTDWPTALNQAACLLKSVLEKVGPKAIGGLISPNATLEEMYIFQSLCRGLGTPHIDHRVREVDTSDQAMFSRVPYSEVPIKALDNCDLVILVGSNVQREQPLLSTRLRRMVNKGGIVISLNCMDYAFPFEVNYKIIAAPDEIVFKLKVLVEKVNMLSEKMKSNEHDMLLEIAKRLYKAKNGAILVGSISRNHSDAAKIRYWIEQLKYATHTKVMHLTEGANATGAWLAGAVPHRKSGGGVLSKELVGLSAHEMIKKRLNAYLLFNIEPDLDCANPYATKAAMTAAECVIAFSPFASPHLLAYTNVLFPIHCFGESEGTFINIEGIWQSFKGSVTGKGESRSGWKALNALSSILGITNESFSNVNAIREKVSEDLSIPVANTIVFPPTQPVDQVKSKQLLKKATQLFRVTEWSLYSTDNLVRQAKALQQSGSHEPTGAYFHPMCAKQLSLQSGDKIQLRQGEALSEIIAVILDERVPENCVWTPAGRIEMATLGPSFGVVEVVVNG